MPKVKLGRTEFDIDSEVIHASACGVTAADCVAFAARMKTGEIRRVKRLLLVRFVVLNTASESQHEFCRATTKPAPRERRRLLPLCNRTTACRRWTL